jgi:hypothetical protein
MQDCVKEISVQQATDILKGEEQIEYAGKIQ